MSHLTRLFSCSDSMRARCPRCWGARLRQFDSASAHADAPLKARKHLLRPAYSIQGKLSLSNNPPMHNRPMWCLHVSTVGVQPSPQSVVPRTSVPPSIHSPDMFTDLVNATRPEPWKIST